MAKSKEQKRKDRMKRKKKREKFLQSVAHEKENKRIKNLLEFFERHKNG